MKLAKVFHPTGAVLLLLTVLYWRKFVDARTGGRA